MDTPGMYTPGMYTPGIDTPGSTGGTGSGAPDRSLNQDAEPPGGGSHSPKGLETVSPDEPAPSQDGGDGPTRDRAPENEAARVIRGGPGSPQDVRPGQPDQASRQGYGRQRDVPQDGPPADVLDDRNIAGDKDFELQPPSP